MPRISKQELKKLGIDGNQQDDPQPARRQTRGSSTRPTAPTSTLPPSSGKGKQTGSAEGKNTLQDAGTERSSEVTGEPCREPEATATNQNSREPPGAFPSNQRQGQHDTNPAPTSPSAFNPRPSPSHSSTSSGTQHTAQAPPHFPINPVRYVELPFQLPRLHLPLRKDPPAMQSSQGQAGPSRERYSYNKYRRDAMILLEIQRRQDQGEVLPGLDQRVQFTEAELATARTVQRMMRRRHRDETQQRALEYLAISPLTTQALMEWRRRFNNGPDDEDEEETDPPPPSVPLNPPRPPVQTPRSRYRTEETEEVRRVFPPPTRSPTRLPPQDHTQRRSPSDPSSSDSGSDRSRRGYRRRHRQRHEPAQTTIDMFSQRRLKPEEMGTFDGHNTSVHLYVRQIQHRVRLYGYQRVLEVLPLCMKGDAMDWYSSLSDSQIHRMTTSIDEWIIALRHRFQKDALLAEDEANKCKHSFERESLDVRQYITRKQTLLYDAGIEGQDELLMIQKIWRDLDPTLQNAVTLDPYMTMEEFVSLCYQKEYSARRAFEQQQRQAAGQLRVAAQEYARSRREAERPGTYRPALQTRTTNPKLPEPVRPALKTIPGGQTTKTPLAYPCQHCGGNHKNYECPDRPPRPRPYGQKRVAFMMDLMDKYNDCDFSDEGPIDSAHDDDDQVMRSDGMGPDPGQPENE
ncbi:hypothetical protein ACJQWK_05150 [Exserohilum turcicum]